MLFSRAIAYAAFLGLKWLSLVAAVLFAALALRYHFDDAGSRPIAGSLAAMAGCLVSVFAFHWLANKIAP